MMIPDEIQVNNQPHLNHGPDDNGIEFEPRDDIDDQIIRQILEAAKDRPKIRPEGFLDNILSEK